VTILAPRHPTNNQRLQQQYAGFVFKTSHYHKSVDKKVKYRGKESTKGQMGGKKLYQKKDNITVFGFLLFSTLVFLLFSTIQLLR